MDEPAEYVRANQVSDRSPPTSSDIRNSSRIAQEAPHQVERGQCRREVAQHIEIRIRALLRIGREQRIEERVSQRRIVRDDIWEIDRSYDRGRHQLRDRREESL